MAAVVNRLGLAIAEDIPNRASIDETSRYYDQRLDDLELIVSCQGVILNDVIAYDIDKRWVQVYLRRVKTNKPVIEKGRQKTTYRMGNVEVSLK